MKDVFEVKERVPAQPIGWLEIKLPKSGMDRLQSYIETAKKNPTNYNKNLAGNISKSLQLKDKDDWFFLKILIPTITVYPKYSKDISILTDDAPYCLPSMWVNFQKQHEFNPVHDHGGVWSFVIWVKIPTDWREQHTLPISANSRAPVASDFEFQFSSMMGNLASHSYPLDKESEGIMLFFPSKLQHQVYPFYNCDEERISISGNILFDPKSL